MLNPGTILDDRYEIVDVVGAGGMSTVYRAKDERLKRYVAVKVLKSDYAQDATFVSKFRVEAQSSAGLTHPNIVSVYDVCEDQGLYFIVMELVEGITLKQYINLNGRLRMDQAITFSIQIASALEAAHEHHVIHRDIKPQNIIVSKSGNIKVTDFGIAKAATSTTMSTTGIGSVHYISPEQARGGYSDERSDIYSLGITMYEMVTGRVPFEGDTNVAIALMHIQNEITPPRELYPDIYPSFEKIIMKCTQKKPERRYLTSAALIADLNRVKENPNIDIVVAPTGVSNAPTQMFSADDMQKIKKQSAQKPVADDTIVAGVKTNPVSDAQPSLEPDRSRLDQLIQDSDEDDFFDDDDDAYQRDEEPVVSQPKGGGLKKVDDYDSYSDYEDEEDIDYAKHDEEDVDPKLAKAVTIGGIAAALIIVVIIFVVIGNIAGLFHFGKKTTEDTTAEVVSEELKLPNIVGLSEDAAVKTLTNSGFTEAMYSIEKVASTDVKEGYVISTSPEAGTMVATNSTPVIVTVSAGPEDKEVPDVTNRTEDEAKALLEEAGFKATSKFDFSDDVDEKLVMTQSPAAYEKAAEGTTVVLTISNGPKVKETTVPDVRNQDVATAKKAIEDANLVVGDVNEVYNSDVAQGQVIDQTIAGGTETKEGTKVGLTVSKGPETKTYNGSVTGTITVNDGANLVGPTYTVTAYISDESGLHKATTVQVDAASATSITLAGSVGGLASDTGTVYFSVINDATQEDISQYYSSNLTVNYRQE